MSTSVTPAAANKSRAELHAERYEAFGGAIRLLGTKVLSMESLRETMWWLQDMALPIFLFSFHLFFPRKKKQKNIFFTFQKKKKREKKNG